MINVTCWFGPLQPKFFCLFSPRHEDVARRKSTLDPRPPISSASTIKGCWAMPTKHKMKPNNPPTLVPISIACMRCLAVSVVDVQIFRPTAGNAGEFKIVN